MVDQITIQSALISVYAKEGILELANLLIRHNVCIYSTGGTYDFLRENGIPATPVEQITTYPTILGGRVKTLHPKIFGGILWQRDQLKDAGDIEKYEIPSIDLVIVDLYPFEKTVSSSNDEQQIIEKIDIGGISLIRAAAKNFRHVMVVPGVGLYDSFRELFETHQGSTALADRQLFATFAFQISSHYDTAIYHYFNTRQKLSFFKQSINQSYPLRYGENPHQKGIYYGDLPAVFNQLNGKELSYNNLVDIDAAIQITNEFTEPTIAIIKHTNPCGLASRNSLKDAWKDALAGDPVSAFGGIISVNRSVTKEVAEDINKLFFEIIVAEGYNNEALEILKTKKNRIILQLKSRIFPEKQFKSVLNGVIEQHKDLKTDSEEDFTYVTVKRPSPEEVSDLLFAVKAGKHLKSNTIVLVKNKQMIGCGMGQPSRVDALKQAILKARSFGFDPEGAVMASDAFFPFADSVEIAYEAGIRTVIQPGGSVRDQDSIEYCDAHEMAMVFTGIRHFKH